MNQVAPYKGGAPSPGMIANNLDDVYGMVREYITDEETRRTVGNILRTSANNIKAMFELQTAEDGKIRPQNMGQLLLLADILIVAGLAPSSYENNPQKVVIGLMKAMEIGVEPITGLGNIMIVNNRASVWGDLAQALVERSGQIAKQVKTEIGIKPEPGLELPNWSPDYGWRVETWRVGQDEPYTGEYTVAQAKRSNLWMNTKKDPWIKDPSRMLFNRARAFSLRDGFSDCLLGMGIVEEQRDYERETELLPARMPQKHSVHDDDEPITKADKAETAPDYGDETELPLGETPLDQGEG